MKWEGTQPLPSKKIAYSIRHCLLLQFWRANSCLSFSMTHRHKVRPRPIPGVLPCLATRAHIIGRPWCRTAVWSRWLVSSDYSSGIQRIASATCSPVVRQSDLGSVLSYIRVPVRVHKHKRQRSPASALDGISSFSN
jgi:hypothetical protein